MTERRGKSDRYWIERAYSLPHTLEELKERRLGLFGLHGGQSAFGEGLADYAHALLAGWFEHKVTQPFRDIARFPLSAQLIYERSRKELGLITTSLQRIRPFRSANGTIPVVERNSEGIAVSGSQTFAADAAHAGQLLVWIREYGDEAPTTLALVPTGSEGLKIRLHPETSSWTTVLYDRVFIPQERILLDRNAAGAELIRSHPFVQALAGYQWAARQLDALELLTGTAFALADQTGLSKDPDIQYELGLLIQELESLKALLYAAELEAERSPAGALLPAPVPVAAAKRVGGDGYRRASELIHRIGGTELLDAPDFAAPSERSEFHRAKSREHDIRRLAWRLAGDEEAARRRQHERFAFGDPIERSKELYRHYPQHQLRERYRAFRRAIDAKAYEPQGR